MLTAHATRHAQSAPPSEDVDSSETRAPAVPTPQLQLSNLSCHCLALLARLAVLCLFNNLDLFSPDLLAGSKKIDREDAYARKDPAGQHACNAASEAIN
jgi:hypothetical protein